MQPRIFPIVLIFAVIPIAAGAAVIHVPADQPTIQAGIDAAVDGDEVIVADGLYRGEGNRSLHFDGKAIMLRSEGTPQRCVIDCQREDWGFSFGRYDGPETVVSGFMVINGYNPYSMGGNGMSIFGGSPTVRNCIIAYCQQGGVHCTWAGGPPPTPLFEGCTFYGNIGGGMECSNSAATLISCAFVRNESSGSGGGLYSMGGDLTISNCLFECNVARYSGGAVFAQHTAIDTFTNCLFAGNRANHGYGGAVKCKGSILTMVNCTFTGNSADEEGGALATEMSGAKAIISNSILWGNTPDEIDNDLGWPQLSHCLVAGGWYGTAIIDADPLFVSGEAGDYLLSQVFAGQAENSPCLDSGSGTASIICYDTPEGTLCLDQMTTRTDGVGDTFVADMGYHYNDLDPLYPPPQEWSWAPCGEMDGALRVYSIDDTAEYRLYAGTGPAGNVYLSEDGGNSWVNTGQLEGAVHVFDVLPASDGRLYAATATADAGSVFVSPDGGYSWTLTGLLAGAEAVFCLLELPGPLLLAGTGPSGAVFATEDGENWSVRGSLPGAGPVHALVALDDGSLIAGSGPDGGVYRSTDGGANWVEGGELPGAENVYSLAELPGGHIIAGTSPHGDLFRTTDLGQSWQALDDLPGAEIVASLAWHLDGRVYAGTTPHGDVFRSDDLGQTWSRTSDLFGAGQVLSLLSAHDGHLYCGTAFNGDIFKSSGPLTVDCAIEMDVDEGVLPFQNHAYVDLVNLTGFNRVFAGDIFVTLANGLAFANWRSGYRVMAPDETYATDWVQHFPDIHSLVGENNFRLRVVDVTPPPYNAPPYPVSGLTETSVFTVTCSPAEWR